MKIGIVTVYDSMNNIGSFLQAYALKIFLEKKGHEVFVIQKSSMFSNIISNVMKINPKRAILHRINRCVKFLKTKNKLNLIKRESTYKKNLDMLIYGSDEIWNMENLYFKDEFFFGTNSLDIKKIAYAVSIGEMKKGTLIDNLGIAKGIFDFERILVRDEYTKSVVEEVVNKELDLVCDPTLMIPLETLESKAKKYTSKYILVYTYGIDKPMEENIVRFAREKGLKIVSLCFWHIWVDKVIQCDPLQFSCWIKNAEYVFTSTFHGAIFTMLNHKKCCILPVRYKVKDIVSRLGIEKKLITSDCTYENFVEIIEGEFPVALFEKRLLKYKNESVKKLEEVLG